MTIDIQEKLKGRNKKNNAYIRMGNEEKKKKKEIEGEGIIMQRIRHQLRIHWRWLRREESADEVANFISAWMKQALSAQERNLKEKPKESL